MKLFTGLKTRRDCGGYWKLKEIN